MFASVSKSKGTKNKDEQSEDEVDFPGISTASLKPVRHAPGQSVHICMMARLKYTKWIQKTKID